MKLLETRDLTRTFERAGTSFEAVSKANFSMEKGEFIHIVGRSGSGKTTFLHMISGILSPTSGEILFEGESYNSMSRDDLAKLRNLRIGFVPQAMGTLPNLTVLENVYLPCLFSSESRISTKDRASALLEEVGLIDLKDQFPRYLSGGETKRLLLARALMNEPKLLICDEPTADLDGETTREVMELLMEFKAKGMSLIVVTHESDLLAYGDRLFEMEKGHLYENTRKEGKDAYS